MGIFEECMDEAESHRMLKVDAILKSLDKEDRESLLTALKEPSISPRRISIVLAKRNIKASRESISKWREINKIGL